MITENSEEQNVVNFFIEMGVFLTPDLMNNKEKIISLKNMVDKIKNNNNSELQQKFTRIIENNTSFGQIEFLELENIKNYYFNKNTQDNENNNNSKINNTQDITQDNTRDSNNTQEFLKSSLQDSTQEFEIKIKSYQENNNKKKVDDFVNFFNSRYRSIEKILRKRPELSNLLSISKILGRKEKGPVAIIGLVISKQQTKNKNLMITLEDPTGKIDVIVSKNKKELYETARDVVEDEVIAITGTNMERVVFVNELMLPDIPATNELKKGKKEHALFLSDLHVGSSYFLNSEFEHFMKWINCEIGNEKQQEMAKNTRYVFIAGDLVDGVGIYPGQEKDLAIKDIFDQYKECAELLSRIPKDKKLILCPGNHDAVRLSEPQPIIPKDIGAPLYKLPNMMMTTNPSTVNIQAEKDFPGFEVLMYHGYSFDYYVSNVDSIRSNGGYERADLIMKFLLQRRHLAPAHLSSLYVPDAEQDPLVISTIPDFFISGHIHRASISQYRNITAICGSCWQDTTDFQKKVGHKPEPARVPIVNLETRETKMLKFIK